MDGDSLIVIDTKANALYRRDMSTGRAEERRGSAAGTRHSGVQAHTQLDGCRLFTAWPPCRTRRTHAGDTQLLAGTEGERGYRDGPGRQALFSSPTAACALPGAGGLVVADSQNACIRLVDQEGNVSTLAGACGEKPGFRDGPGPEALFGAGIRSVACLANCSVLVADAAVGRLRCGRCAGPARSLGCQLPPVEGAACSRRMAW